jgi:hypothetical protein
VSIRSLYFMVFLSLVFSHDASAEFLGKYKDWREISLERKRGYVMGYVDNQLVLISKDRFHQFQTTA